MALGFSSEREEQEDRAHAAAAIGHYNTRRQTDGNLPFHEELGAIQNDQVRQGALEEVARREANQPNPDPDLLNMLLIGGAFRGDQRGQLEMYSDYYRNNAAFRAAQGDDIGSQRALEQANGAAARARQIPRRRR